MQTKKILPQTAIQNEFKKFVKRRYKKKEFPQFIATEEFFQWYFETDLKLNDFKNMIGFVKDSEDFEHVRTDKRRNYYRVKDRQ
jgi:hypothetical protein